MIKIIAIMLGTAFGAVIRTYMSSYVNQKLSNASFPWSTFMINMLACYLIGVLSVSKLNFISQSFLIAGFLGGLSTFSTFANEAVRLIQNKTTRIISIIYVLASLLIGVLLINIGIFMTN